MADRTPVYVAAPYHDPNPRIVAWNVARACLLGRLAARCGYVPTVVHAEIHGGVYGDDNDPAQRAAGRALTLAKLDGVLAAGGRVWALLRDDGEMSEGTRAEVNEARDTGSAWTGSTWAEWRTEASAHPDLLPAWDALAVRPIMAGPWDDSWGVRGRYYGDPDDGDSTSRILSDGSGWYVWTPENSHAFDHGPETGTAGEAAADAALRARGLL